MQTFMPCENFDLTAQVLDDKRLNKQALEAWQIMMTNLKLDPNGEFREPRGWVNHPAAVMWRGYEQALLAYIEAMVQEWVVNRHYKSTIFDKALNTFTVAVEHDLTEYTDELILPEWMLNEIQFDKVQKTHRIALLAKNYGWYSQFRWPEDNGFQPPAAYEYYWPNN